MLGLDAKTVRKGSASCHVSPLSDAGIMSTTRTPGGGGGGGGGEGGGLSPPRLQAATTTATRMVVARMGRGYTGGGRGVGGLILPAAEAPARGGPGRHPLTRGGGRPRALA